MMGFFDRLSSPLTRCSAWRHCVNYASGTPCDVQDLADAPCLGFADKRSRKKSPKILAMVPALPQDLETAKSTIKSIRNQSIPVETIRLVTEIGRGQTVAERVSSAFNKAFETIDLAEYDYLLRVDSDTTIPPNFIEENLKLNVAVVGGGHAHLINMPIFLKTMGGRFQADSDDSYLEYKFIHCGYQWKLWSAKALPRLNRKPGAIHHVDYFLHRGKVMWLCGYEPLHVLGQWRWDFRNILAIPEYFICMIKRVPQLDVHSTTFWLQIHSLKEGLTRRRRY